jgi:MFS family permease
MSLLDLKRFYWQVTAIIMAAMILALAGISYFTQDAFERMLLPELERKAGTVGLSAASLMNKAMGFGIPYTTLYGVAESFAEIRRENPELAYIGATDPEGKLLFESGNRAPNIETHMLASASATARQQNPGDWRTVLVGGQYVLSMPLLSISDNNERVGSLHIGISQSHVQNMMHEVMLDIVVVLCVAIFFTLEVLRFAAGNRLESSLEMLTEMLARIAGRDFRRIPVTRLNDEIGHVMQRCDAMLATIEQRYDQLRAKLNGLGAETRGALESKLNELYARYQFGQAIAAPVAGRGVLSDIRAPFFVFILAEEMTRSFLPAYIKELLVPIQGLSPQVVIGLPIALFMLIVAIGQPYLGAWSERVGRRKAMLAGATLSVVGFLATAFASSLYDLLVWRSLCALGYATVFVAAQGYILDRVGESRLTEGFALFVGAIMVATICGPSIGGLLADNMGFRAAFLVSAVIAAFSFLVILRLPDRRRDVHDEAEDRMPSFSDFLRLMTKSRFLLLTAVAAIPAKVILIGFGFYLVPLYIVSIGSTPAMAGRMLMVYAVLMVLIVPIAARYANSQTRREYLVVAGLCLSGIGGLLTVISGSFAAIFGVVILLGLGQALSIAPQGALVGEICKDEIARFGSGPVYGAYRMLERLGNVLGPILAGFLLVRYDYIGAFAIIGAGVFVCGLIFAAGVVWTRRIRTVTV